MKITTITFSGSNPSMGPDNEQSSNSLSMENYPKELQALLDDTKVNGLVNLREYIQLSLDKNHIELQKINNVKAKELLGEGARIIDLTFSIEGQPSVTLSDLRLFNLSGQGYRDFETLIREKGNVLKIHDPGNPFDKKPDVVMPPPLQQKILDNSED